MSLNSAIPITSHSSRPPRERERWPCSAPRAGGRFGRPRATGSHGAASDVRLASRRRPRRRAAAAARAPRRRAQQSSAAPSSRPASTSRPSRSPDSGPMRASRRVGEGGTIGIVSRWACVRSDSRWPGCRRPARLRALARQAIAAVEHERGVPRAAVGGADGERSIVRREEQGAVSQDQRDDDVHAAASASCRAAGGASRQPEPGEQRQARSASSDSSSLTLKATPSATAASSSQAVRPLSRGAHRSTSARTISSIISPSIVSLRAVMTSIGRTASASAAASPARTPNGRRTAANSSGTDSVPASASGSFSADEVKPRSLTLRTCSHRSTGGLSIETRPRARRRRRRSCARTGPCCAPRRRRTGRRRPPQVRQAQPRGPQRQQRRREPAGSRPRRLRSCRAGPRHSATRLA